MVSVKNIAGTLFDLVLQYFYPILKTPGNTEKNLAAGTL